VIRLGSEKFCGRYTSRALRASPVVQKDTATDAEGQRG
jgi:hypothetical protein